MSEANARRVLGQLEAFDPEAGRVVLAPEEGGAGTWVGSPGVLHEPALVRFLLTYRRRRPRGDAATERGWRCAVAVSEDGERFRDVWVVEKSELRTSSMERFCLVPRPGGGYLLYISYVDPADSRWRIDLLEADGPESFDVRQGVPVLTAASTGTEGVKDPYVLRIGPAFLLFASYAAAETLDRARRAEAHRTADIYNTGLTTHPTGLARSLDGRDFSWQPGVLGVGRTWDRYQARLNSVARVGHLWAGFYDGSASERENYEERCGLALSSDLERWTRVTTEGPWLTSPHGSHSLRYVDVAPVGAELWIYYEYARADGAHELRLNKVHL